MSTRKRSYSLPQPCRKKKLNVHWSNSSRFGVIVSSLVLVAAKIAGNIAGVAATSAIQGGMALGARAGINTVGRPIGIATKSIGSKIFPDSIKINRHQVAIKEHQVSPWQRKAKSFLCTCSTNKFRKLAYDDVSIHSYFIDPRAFGVCLE